MESSSSSFPLKEYLATLSIAPLRYKEYANVQTQLVTCQKYPLALKVKSVTPPIHADPTSIPYKPIHPSCTYGHIIYNHQLQWWCVWGSWAGWPWLHWGIEGPRRRYRSCWRKLRSRATCTRETPLLLLLFTALLSSQKVFKHIYIVLYR